MLNDAVESSAPGMPAHGIISVEMTAIRLPLTISRSPNLHSRRMTINELTRMGCAPGNLRRRIQRNFSIGTFMVPMNPVFGVPLIHVLCSEKSPYVAKIVIECVEFIERDENITKDIYSAARPPSDRRKCDRLKEKVFGCEWLCQLARCVNSRFRSDSHEWWIWGDKVAGCVRGGWCVATIFHRTEAKDHNVDRFSIGFRQLHRLFVPIVHCPCSPIAIFVKLLFVFRFQSGGEPATADHIPATLRCRNLRHSQISDASFVHVTSWTGDHNERTHFENLFLIVVAVWVRVVRVTQRNWRPFGLHAYSIQSPVRIVENSCKWCKFRSVNTRKFSPTEWNQLNGCIKVAARINCWMKNRKSSLEISIFWPDIRNSKILVVKIWVAKRICSNSYVVVAQLLKNPVKRTHLRSIRSSAFHLFRPNAAKNIQKFRKSSSIAFSLSKATIIWGKRESIVFLGPDRKQMRWNLQWYTIPNRTHCTPFHLTVSVHLRAD